MSDRKVFTAFKGEVFGGLSRLFKALSNPGRLEILELLSQGEKSVDGIVQGTGMSVANTSQHLQLLKSNNIVRSRKEGHYVYYSLISDEFLSLYLQMTKYALKEIDELEKLVHARRDGFQTQDAVSLDELEKMVKAGNVLLLDLRPAEEYLSGHISGAQSVPMEELVAGLKEIGREKEIVAYCRGPFCLLADEAVSILRGSGYAARRLEAGYPAWKVRAFSPS